MSALTQALQNLSQAVGKLEESLEHIQTRVIYAQNGQHDMFAETDLGKEVAKRLDSAISQIETVLDGQGA